MVVKDVTIFERTCNGYSKSNIPTLQPTIRYNNLQCDVGKCLLKPIST